jgi:hypothetical protein
MYTMAELWFWHPDAPFYCDRLTKLWHHWRKCVNHRGHYMYMHVIWWKIRFRKVTCFAFIEICILMSQKKIMRRYTHTLTLANACTYTMAM